MSHSTWLDTTQPLVIGHRGASADAPENTLASFALAVEQGADGIEFDVQLSRDGVPIVIHDGTVDRTTDGTGRVTDLTLAKIRRLTIAGEHPVPLLDEVFERLGRSTLYNIELKGLKINDGGLSAAVAAAIVRYGVAEQALISSFTPFFVRAARKHMPSGVPVAHLRERRATRIFHTFVHAEADHPLHTLVDEELMTWARRHGVRVNAWTVDDATEARRLIRLGVNGIITNRPGALRRELAEMEP